jgi:hypothetical protein
MTMDGTRDDRHDPMLRHLTIYDSAAVVHAPLGDESRR